MQGLNYFKGTTAVRTRIVVGVQNIIIWAISKRPTPETNWGAVKIGGNLEPVAGIVVDGRAIQLAGGNEVENIRTGWGLVSGFSEELAALRIGRTEQLRDDHGLFVRVYVDYLWIY